jgi:hypothetical protein
MTKARDLGDNAQNTKPKVVDAKGDLIVGTGADAASRLAVSDNGSTLVADSAATVGLRYQPNTSAGKNKVINGDFSVWQRGTSLTGGSIVDGTFLADRWRNTWNGTNPTNISLTRETFTPAELNAIGYGDAKYYQKMAIVTIGASTGYRIEQRIEDATTFAGQNVNVSFWCKADEAHTLTVSFSQNFGSGGSAATSTTVTMSDATTPTSWTRVTGTVALPSISGKTIGDGNYLHIRIEAATDADGDEFSIWGVQVEAGSVATAFQTATGTLQGELAACQRYYIQYDGNGNSLAAGTYYSTTAAFCTMQFPVQMRVAPTQTIDATGINIFSNGASNASTAVSSGASDKVLEFSATTSARTAGDGCFARITGAAPVGIKLSSEL